MAVLSLVSGTARILPFSLSVHLVALPFSRVLPIGQDHFAPSVLFAMSKQALVHVAIGIVGATLAIVQAMPILALVLVTVGMLGSALSVRFIVLPFPVVHPPIRPNICPTPLPLAVHKQALVGVTVGGSPPTWPIPQSTVILSLVLLAVGMAPLAISVSLVILPFSLIHLSILGNVLSKAFLQTLDKTACHVQCSRLDDDRWAQTRSSTLTFVDITILMPAGPTTVCLVVLPEAIIA